VACTDDAIAAYLEDGTVPQRTRGRHSDLQCPPVPQPDPSPAATLSERSSGSRAARGIEAIRQAIAAATQPGEVLTD
jgi:hypothetical protein